jgi:hypothetical protein
MKQLMKPMEANPMRLLAGACSLVLTLGLAQPSVAQQTAKPQTQAQPVAAASAFDALAPVSFSALMPGTPTAQTAARPAAEEEEESPKPQKPGGEGIKVHGHWVIDVRNPDGTLAQHKDFQNSLVKFGAAISGDQLLAGLLSGNLTPGDPAIVFISTVSESSVTPSDPTTYCGNYTATVYSGICSFFTTPESLINGSTYPNLQTGLHAVVNFSPAVNWVLSGNWTVPSGTNAVLYVQTFLPTCVSEGFVNAQFVQNFGPNVLSGSSADRSADVSSKQCNAAMVLGLNDFPVLFPLTSTLVPGEPPTGMPVTPGQIIQVSVTISFS